jgi:chaperone required for assembly of F1-ATPase
MASLKALLEQQDEFALAALRALSGLAASLIIGLSALEDGADHEALWIAANLEEDWQAERWGRDAEAEERRERRREAFLAAARFVKLARA